MNSFAPVASLAGYELLWHYGSQVLGNYHLLIAPEVLKDPEAWHDFWVGTHLPDQFIIMDNGLIETGGALDPQGLIEAAQVVNASCIVLPDVLGDAAKTIKVATAAYNELSRSRIPLMGVIQGQTWSDLTRVGDVYRDMNVAYYSIPRRMVQYFSSRVSLVNFIWKRYHRPIHLLGFSDDLQNDIRSVVEEGVMGIDSALPLWLGQHNVRLPPVPPRMNTYGGRPEHYWTDPFDTSLKQSMASSNVDRVRYWIGAQVVLMQDEQQGPAETPAQDS